MKKILIFCVWFLASQVNGQITSLVNPFIGTSGHGHTFPGAVWPHGMVQLSPDTRIDGSWDGCSGYHYSDSILYGFSHTHLSGTGVSDYGDILLLPITKWLGPEPHRHQANFSHSHEFASPGFYSVKLIDSEIEVALTASARVGMHQYTFPENSQRMVLLDLLHRDDTLETQWEITAPNAIRGMRRSSAWARNQTVCFAIEFSEPFEIDSLQPGNPLTYFKFDIADRPLLVKVGLSFTTPEAAASNLEAEIPHWNFDAVRQMANAAWEADLKRIRVFGGSHDEQVSFYTALYHTMIHPTIASDVEGTFRGMDNQIYKDTNRTHYTIFSLWDTFRALHPLFTILDPDRALAFIETMLNQYHTGGRLPVWELASNETDCMIGYHSVSVIADAWAKGIDQFDPNLALEAMVKSATWNHLGLPEYIAHGYLDVQHEHESVSKTLEYAYNDWCIGSFAASIGREDIAKEFFRRGQYWKNLFDQQSGFIRPKNNGSWQTPFNPSEVNNNYTEANGWQYTFFVPQDIPGLISAMGGTEAFEEKLDALFTAAPQTTGRTQVDITGLIGQYAHGNEPSHHMAYLYNYVNKPRKTQEKVLQIMRDFYPNAPDGCIGNEDAGQMSAWFVFSAMGFYPVTPGSTTYTTGIPLFDSIVVKLPNEQHFIITKDQHDSNLPLHAKLNDKLPHILFIKHHEIMAGGLLAFQKVDEEVMPPPYQSSGDFKSPIAINPTFGNAPLVFEKKQSVSLSAAPGHQIFYRFPEHNLQWQSYNNPFDIYESVLIEARTTNAVGEHSKTVQARYYRLPNQWQVTLKSTYNPQYHAGGPRGLVDGIRGSINWRKGDWQGYQGHDFVAEIDLQKKQFINEVQVSFLQDTRSWIVLPRNLSVWVSKDGKRWTQAFVATHDLDAKEMEPFTFELGEQLTHHKKIRFIRVTAENFGTLPEWHPGSGHPAFIFVDEVIIK